MNTTATATPRETWKTIGQSPSGRKTYQVSNLGRCKTINNKTGEEITSWGNLNRQTGYLSFAGDYVHRLVAQVFLKKPAKGKTVVQHLDCNKHNCACSNLAWATTKENNQNEITNQRRREAHAAVKHAGEIIKAERDGEIRYYKTGIAAAADIGCSHVLIFNAINKRQSARRARGWNLSWIPISEAR